MLHRRILAINDISGLGQCSLSAAIPIINAFGFETVSLPTAILTNQTGYESFYMFDCTDLIPHFIEEWKKLNLHFETVYTGFFASEKQIDLIIELINNFKSSINKIIVDPIMADSGKVYSTYTQSMCDKISYLTEIADVITPNLTEACIISGYDYDVCISADTFDRLSETILKIENALNKKGPSVIIITGVPFDGYLYNFVYDSNCEDRFFTKNTAHKGGYSGTGDTFASIICGALSLGISLKTACTFAADYIEQAIKETADKHGLYNDGTIFQKQLYKITDISRRYLNV